MNRLQELLKKTDVWDNAYDIAIENKDKIGYVQTTIKTDNSYKIDFIPGDFNKELFIYTPKEDTEETTGNNFENAFFGYFSYYWEIDNTTQYIKELILETSLPVEDALFIHFLNEYNIDFTFSNGSLNIQAKEEDFKNTNTKTDEELVSFISNLVLDTLKNME
jgi:hypothetical protein